MLNGAKKHFTVNRAISITLLLLLLLNSDTRCNNYVESHYKEKRKKKEKRNGLSMTGKTDNDGAKFPSRRMIYINDITWQRHATFSQIYISE